MGETATQLSFDVSESIAPLRVVPATSPYQRGGKRVLDVTISLVLGVILLPVVLAIALAIRVGLGRGVLYRQARIGREGEPFTIWKFRTMRHDRRTRQSTRIPAERRSDHKNEQDPRHTGLGRLLRRLSLDELPQLWNVLCGDMSLVGPRPELVEVARQRGYADHIRHTVRPGITGPYQLSALRHFGDLRDGLELDVDYVQRITLRRDAMYLLRTLTVLVGGRAPGR